jgi:hypothetical protein
MDFMFVYMAELSYAVYGLHKLSLHEKKRFYCNHKVNYVNVHKEHAERVGFEPTKGV